MLYFAKCHYSCPKLYILSFKKKSRSFPQCFDLFPSSAERTGYKKRDFRLVSLKSSLLRGENRQSIA